MNKNKLPILFLIVFMLSAVACAEPPTNLTTVAPLQLPQVGNPAPIDNGTNDIALVTEKPEVGSADPVLTEETHIILLPTFRMAEETNSAEIADTTAYPVPAPAQEASADPAIYVIQVGDSLGSIAEQLGVDIVALAEINHITDPNQIDVGQPLFIPQVTAATIAVDNAAVGENSADVTHYTVQQGDALSLIAEQFDLPITDLLLANDLSINDFVYVGQVLLIPNTEGVANSAEITPPEDSTNETTQTYTVLSGDSLGSIALQLDISIERIAAANNITDYHAIYVGQVLIIP